MLNPTEVLPFLMHPEPDVRGQASKYLTDMGDAAPLETADELWRAIEQFGESLTEVGTKQKQRFLYALSRVRQNEASVDKAVKLLTSGDSDPNLVYAVNGVLQQMPLDLFEKRREEIWPLITPESRTWLEHRHALKNLPVEEIWSQFEALAEKAEAAKDSKAIDSHAGSRFIEALARHPDLAIPRAISVLKDPGDRWWLERWCVELLGELRHAPAIDLLLEKMKVEDADILIQTAGDVLGRMDAATVVPKLEQAYASDDPFARMAVGECLAKIKHPLAEDLLARLLTDEQSSTASTSLCVGLCDLCTTTGLELLRKAVIDDHYDGTVADMKELLVTISKMTGFAPPELGQWKKELNDPAYKEKRRSSFLKSFGMNEKTVELFQKYLQTGTLGEPAESREPARVGSLPQSTKPFRREEPKTGRNDPCPCGSGKKYKKCCGK